MCICYFIEWLRFSQSMREFLIFNCNVCFIDFVCLIAFWMICMILKLASILLANQNRTNESEIHLAKVETFFFHSHIHVVFSFELEQKNKTLAVESEHLKNERNWIEWEPRFTRVKSRNVYAHDLAFEWIWVESRCASKAKIAEQREWRACALRFVVRFSFNGQ